MLFTTIFVGFFNQINYQLSAGECNHGRSGGGPQWENGPQSVYSADAQPGPADDEEKIWLKK